MRAIFVKVNEFRYNVGCGKLFDDCENCSVPVMRKFPGFGEVPSVVVRGKSLPINSVTVFFYVNIGKNPLGKVSVKRPYMTPGTSKTPSEI